MNPFERVSIIGVGLLGGSLAKVLRKLGLAKSIIGYGRNKANLDGAKNLNIIDDVAPNIQSAAKDADLIVFCSPVQTIAQLAMEMSPHIKPGCLVTDVGSTKETLISEIEKFFPEGISFIGAHPIAGGEMSGFRLSSDTLFDGAHCIITPTDKSDPESLKMATELWKTIGMQVSIMDPKEHDFIFGAVSHLPHVLAFALVRLLDKKDSHDEIFKYAAGGFKDFTRIASSDPGMWLDICMNNKDEIIPLIRQINDELEEVAQFLIEGDSESVYKTFATAKSARQRFLDQCDE